MKGWALHNSECAAGQVQPPSQQATRHARRIYVGGLPPTANEQNIATFFSNALAAVGGTTAGPGKTLPPPPKCSPPPFPYHLMSPTHTHAQNALPAGPGFALQLHGWLVLFLIGFLTWLALYLADFLTG